MGAGGDDNTNMEENIKPEIPAGETPEGQTARENITLSDAMSGVFAEPRRTFEAVKASTKRNYWLVPILISIIVTLIASYLVINDEELYSEIKTMQTEGARKRLEKAVKDGNMSQEQMNEQMEQIEKAMDKAGPIFLTFAILGPIVGAFFVLFFRGIVFWGAVKILKGTATYMMVICVLGLISLIDAIQTVVNTALAILTGRLQANLGLGLIFTKEAVGESMMKFLGHFDLFNFWYLIVLAIGISAVSDMKTPKSMIAVFTLWLIWIVLSSFVSIPFVGA
jgi:hypothetical protein